MKTELRIIFRSNKDQVDRFLPPDLTFLQEKMQDFTTRGGAFVDSVYVSEELQQRLIGWGRTLEQGMSVIRSIGISDHYERADLPGLEIVELFSTSLDETGTVNDEDAFFFQWECFFCWRTASTQEKDIVVRPLPKKDFVLSNTVHEMLASGRLHDMLKCCSDLQFRSLLNKSNKKEYVQIVMPKACEIVLESSPVQLENPCPICGRYQVVLRQRYIEGQSSSSSYEYPYLAIGKDQPFSIQRPETAITICRSPTVLGRFEPSTIVKGTNIVGERGPGRGGFGENYFASAELVGSLLDAGMTGIGFRPVNVIS